MLLYNLHEFSTCMGGGVDLEKGPGCPWYDPLRGSTLGEAFLTLESKVNDTASKRRIHEETPPKITPLS